MKKFVFLGRGGLLSSICLDFINKNGFVPEKAFLQSTEESPYPNITELICIKNNVKYELKKSIQDTSVLNYIKDKKIDFVIVASLGEIIKKNLLDLVPFYNVHMGVLPFYRGAFTNFWKILNGDDIYGVTIHQMEEKIDTGKALSIVEKDFSTIILASDFFRRNYEMAASALVDVLNNIYNSNINFIMLDYSLGKYYAKYTENDLILFAEEDVLKLHKKINRLQFYGIPILENYKVISSQLLYYGDTNKHLSLNKVNNNKIVLTNSTGVLEIILSL